MCPKYTVLKLTFRNYIKIIVEIFILVFEIINIVIKLNFHPILMR